jgi:hypothetical protein
MKCGHTRPTLQSRSRATVEAIMDKADSAAACEKLEAILKERKAAKVAEIKASLEAWVRRYNDGLQGGSRDDRPRCDTEITKALLETVVARLRLHDAPDTLDVMQIWFRALQ